MYGNILRFKVVRTLAKKLLSNSIKSFAKFIWGQKLLLLLTKTYTVNNPYKSESIWLFQYILEQGNFGEYWVENARIKNGSILSLNLSDLNQRKLFFFEGTEPEVTRLFEKILKPGNICIDVGANVGYYSLLSAKLVGDTGKVMGFEPNPEIFECFLNNIKLNGFEDIILPFQNAIGEQLGKINIFTSKGWSGISSRFNYSEFFNRTPIEVEVITLDEIVAREKLDRVDLIKIDIEGGELLALQGSIQVLKRYRPDVICEVSPSLLTAIDIEPIKIFNFMFELGYKAYSIRENTLEMVNITSDSSLNILLNGNVYFTAKNHNNV